MPCYQEGQVFQPTSIDMVGGETSPPSLLTEADLISLMEKHGIGMLLVCYWYGILAHTKYKTSFDLLVGDLVSLLRNI